MVLWIIWIAFIYIFTVWLSYIFPNIINNFNMLVWSNKTKELLIFLNHFIFELKFLTKFKKSSEFSFLRPLYLLFIWSYICFPFFHYILFFCRVKKIKVTAPRGVWIFLEYQLSEFCLKTDKWDKKGYAIEVDIFDKQIVFLVSSSWTQYFRIGPRLQQSFSCSRQSKNRFYSAWCITYRYSTFYVSIFLVSGKRGRERER